MKADRVTASYGGERLDDFEVVADDQGEAADRGYSQLLDRFGLSVECLEAIEEEPCRSTST